MKLGEFVRILQTMNPDYEIHPEMTVNFLGIMAEGLKLPEEEKHKIRHQVLHGYLDELVADMIQHTSKLPSHTSLLDFMTWSNKQTQNPTEE